jgi:YggT family protein
VDPTALDLEVVVALIIALVGTLLLLFELLLLARAVLDWSVMLAGPAGPGSIRSRLSQGVHLFTEPVLAPVRRVVPPLRVGPVALDVAFLLVFVGVIALRQLLLWL